ncbi:TonB-dependent receptor [Sphingomonas bacterium]|uniref:TonB-dependent receptor n=1 Tax=Sphingomonas bacterium TaxID=1895847 RepID=UPI001576AEA6|nr:TonB-dependent receptor [Sphingomonas bacterium]
MRLGRLSAAITALASVAWSTLAQAQVAGDATQGPSEQTGLADIVVTGTKTGAQALQRTPDTVSVIGGDLIANQGLNNIRDVATYIPNLTFTRSTSQAIITIRGIGSNNVNAGSDPDVTTQVDGVYIARPVGQWSDFLDVERLEVLRGPQGTLYGRNAVGGTINVISRTPATSFGGEARATYGNYNDAEGELYLTGPLAGDRLRASIALDYRRHDAYLNNIVPGVHDLGNANRGGARVQLRWEPASDIDATTRADYAKVHKYYDGFQSLLAPTSLAARPFVAPLANSEVGNYSNVAINNDNPLSQKIGGVSEDVNWHLGGGFTIKSLTAYRALRSLIYGDSDSTEVFGQYLRSSETEHQFSQELNLQYNQGPLKAVGGLYYFGDRDEQHQQVQVPPSVITPPVASFTQAAQPVIRTNSYAAFAQGVYEFLPRLSLTLGLRYTTENKRIDQRTSRNVPYNGGLIATNPPPFSLRRTDHAFTPKFGLDYQATDSILLYASITRGYKSGGFNFSSATPVGAAFDPEQLWSYEGGIKSEWLDHRLRLNLTGFHYDYTNLQVQNLLGPGNQNIANAASAKVNGVEFEFVAKPARAFQFAGNASYLDATYQSYPRAALPAGYFNFVPVARRSCTSLAPPVCFTDASGNHLSSAPRFSGLLAADYTPEVGAFRFGAHLDFAFRSRTYYDASNNLFSSQPALGLFNANLSLGPPGETAWRLELFAKNLTDRKYYQVISGSGQVPGGIIGDPRTYGARIGYRF